jgi:hypothetical protein
MNYDYAKGVDANGRDIFLIDEEGEFITEKRK